MHFSFLQDSKGDWQLSPAYDLVYSKGVTTKGHQMKLNNKGVDFTLDDLLKISDNYFIPRKEAINMIQNTINSLSDFTTRAKKLGISSSMINGCWDNMQRQKMLV